MPDTPSRAQLVRAIPVILREMMQLRSHAAPEPWLDLDLTVKQLKVLFILDAQGPARPSVIAAAIGVSAASVTGVLDRLAEQGYIERGADPDDRRALRVQLTEAGAGMVSSLHTAGQQRLTESLNGMSEDDLRALHQGVAALVEATRAGLGRAAAHA